MKSLFLLFTFWLSALSLFAQHYVSGQVLSNNGKAVEFATVSLFPISDSTNIRGVITKPSTGSFKIEHIEKGDYQLTIQMLGYEDWKKLIQISADLELGKITLNEEAALLDEIEVVAEQSTLESHLGKKVLRIGQDLASTGSNAFEALESIPSVTTTQRGEVQIRGNSNVIIYINGKRNPT